jgi:long-subunit fatty acid transport protein
MKKIVTIVTALLITCTFSHAQFIEDALRLNRSDGMITPRVANMGVAYHGMVDDIGALLYNPAGIGIIGKNEFSFGMGFRVNNTETDFLKSLTPEDTRDEFITNLGIVSPFKTGNNSAAIGIGYFLESNYDYVYDFDGFNQSYSRIQHDIDDGKDKKLANKDHYLTKLFLADSLLTAPVYDSLQQTGRITESGGLHNISGALAYNINKNVSLGISLIGKWGSFDYERQYSEIDVHNRYNTYIENDWTTTDLKSFNIDEKFTQEISGISGAIGVVGRLEDFMRISASIRFPTYYEVTEEFSNIATSNFDNGDSFTDSLGGETSYNVTTPFVYSAGVSVNAAGLTFSAGVEYSDASQIEFNDATETVMELNKTILRELVGQTTWGFGVEYDLPWLPMVVRSSFSSTTSPYSQDIPNANYTRFAIGGGVYLSKSVRLDGTFQWTDVSEELSNYKSGNGAKYILKRSPTNIGFQITYRY